MCIHFLHYIIYNRLGYVRPNVVTICYTYFFHYFNLTYVRNCLVLNVYTLHRYITPLITKPHKQYKYILTILIESSYIQVQVKLMYHSMFSPVWRGRQGEQLYLLLRFLSQGGELYTESMLPDGDLDSII